MAIDLQQLREQLQGVDWVRGLTRDGLRLRWPGLPQEVYMHLPSEKHFASPEELVLFVHRRLELARVEEIPEGGALEDGGPADWGESATSGTLVTPEPGDVVGFGSDPGYTDAGSVQTGAGREGTTFGDRDGESVTEPGSVDRP